MAQAGPPGVLDDPHAVGKGTVEIILATSAAEQAGEKGLHGPIFDLTVGVVDGLDFLLRSNRFMIHRVPWLTVRRGRIARKG